MAITKPAVRSPWADAAVNPTDIVDPDIAHPGYVGKGWVLSSVPPPRQYFNWLINYAFNGIRYFSRRGIVDWDPLETYVLGDIVRGDNGIVLQSLQNPNLNNTPSTSPAFWGGLTGYALQGALGSFVTQASLNTQLLNYVTQSQLATTIANYYTQAQVNALLTAYVTNAVLTSTLANYETVSAFNTKIATYSTTAQMNTALAAYASLSFLSANYYTQAQVNSLLSPYATTAALNAAIATRAALNSPIFTGNPTGPTPATTDADTSMATTGFVRSLVRFGVSNGLASAPGATVAFSPAFPTACDAVVAVPFGGNATVSVLSKTNASFQLISGTNGPCAWIAYGH